MRGALTLLLVLGALVAGAFVWFRATTAERVGGPSALSVADVYRLTQQELRTHDGIYLAEIEAASDFGPFSSSGTIKRWVDVRRDVAREESVLAPWGSSTMITTRDGRYWRDTAGRITTSPARYWTCNGAGIAASALLGCPGPTERSSAEVRQGVYEGRPAIVLVTTGNVSGSDETYTFTRRLYLDATTYLPLALEGDGQFDFGQVVPAHERYRFQHRFVPSDALATDLFDPASIGYAAADPVQTLDRASTDLHVYWLGREFSGSLGLPALVLSKIDAPEHGPGYRYLLYYAARDDPYAPPIVTLQLWPRTTWDAVVGQAPLGNVWDDPCWAREELTLANGKAVVFSGFAGQVRMGAPAGSGSPCPSQAHDSFLAHVYFADTVILLSAPSASGVGGMTWSPYDNREAIEAVVRGLRQR
jgi:hypothetical protein